MVRELFEIWRTPTVHSFPGEQNNFELNFLTDTEPVKLFQYRCDEAIFTCFR